MPTFLWKIKSRVETLFHLSPLFNNLTSSVFESLSGQEVFFVEIGANDGVSADPLYKYVTQRKKWSGVYVEPQKAVFDKLVKTFEGYDNLFFENIAISDKEQELTLYVPKDITLTGIASLSPQLGVLSRINAAELEPQKVKTMPITYLIEKYNLTNKKCLILLIDVEGYESVIIFTIDFSLFSPDYILFEHAHMTYDTHRSINGHLAKNGYKIYIDKFDTLAYKPR